MIYLDRDFILEVAPKFSGSKAKAQAQIVGSISGHFSAVLDRYDINTRLRVAHFMGQVTHECAGFRTTEEFADGSAYEDRKDLGNTKKGDGPRFKGRGLIQLTGRANYQTIGKRLGIDLEVDPERAADPVTSLRIACEYWKSRKINTCCDLDDLLKVTKKVNGGLTGLEDRRRYYRKAKQALDRRRGLVVGVQQDSTTPVVQLGSMGATVTRLQRKLNAVGFALAVDGAFGPATEMAVRQFQQQRRLVVDGIVGAVTWDALDKAAI